MRIVFLSVATLGLAACASTPQVRGLANNTGTFVSSLQIGTEQFIKNQNQHNALNAERLNQFVANGSQDRANVRQQQLAWTGAGDTIRLATYDAATRHTAEEIISEITAQTRVQAPAFAPLDSTPIGGYEATKKALAEVATKPKASLAQREFIIFGSVIFDTMNTLSETAKKDTEKTKDNVTATDAATNVAAAEIPR